MDALASSSVPPNPSPDRPAPLCPKCGSKSSKVHKRNCVQMNVTATMIDPESSLPGATRPFIVPRNPDDSKFYCPQISCIYAVRDAGGLTTHAGRCPKNQASNPTA